MENSASVAESDSGQVKQKIPHPDGIDSEKRVYELILDYQREGNPETRQAIVQACSPLIDNLIRQHNFCAYEDPDALRSECIIKLFKAIRHYDPARGRAFSCLSVAFTRFLISYVQTVRTRTKRNGQANLSADTSQEKGCSAGSAKEADAVHHDSLKRKTARVSRFS
jgi:hypothetical protein